MTPLLAALSLSVSFASLRGDTGSPAAGIGASVRVPLGPSTFVEPEIGFWRRRSERPYDDVRARDVGLSFVVASRPAPLRAFLGTGAGAHETRAFDTYLGRLPAVRRLHLHTLAGVEGRWGRVAAFGGLRFEASFPLGLLWTKAYAGIRITPGRVKR